MYIYVNVVVEIIFIGKMGYSKFISLLVLILLEIEHVLFRILYSHLMTHIGYNTKIYINKFKIENRRKFINSTTLNSNQKWTGADAYATDNITQTLIAHIDSSIAD